MEKNRQVPPSPPPPLKPYYCPNHHIATPQVLERYLGHYLYIWLYGGGSFWMFPLRMEGYFLAGYLWEGDGWRFARLPMSKIDSIY